MLTDLERRVLDHISAEEVTQLLQELVACESSEDESEVVKVVARALERDGIATERQHIVDHRENVIARLGSPGGRRLILTSHHDTVPIGEPSTWSHPPLGGTIVDGRLYGRGASDDKSGVAAMVAALVAIRRSGATLDGEVLLASVGGESVGNLGMNRLMDGGITADFAIVGEYSEADKIAIAYRGVLWGRLELIGRSAHPGRWEMGVDAIGAAVETFIPALGAHEFTYDPHPLLPDPKLIVTRINGGHATNTVADRCDVVFDVRLLPGQDADAVWTDLTRTVERAADRAPGIRASLHRFHMLQAFETSGSNEDVLTLAKSIEDCGGPYPKYMGKVGFCDANVLVHRGGIPSVAYGPGNPSGIGADEYCELESLLLTARTYATAALRILNAG